MKPNKLIGIVAINAFVVLLFLFTQNCGRVTMVEDVQESVSSSLGPAPSPLSVSVSSELVIRVVINKSKSFFIPTANDSAKIVGISLDPEKSVLETQTNLGGSIQINPETWETNYTPAVGVIGSDRITLQVTGSDGSQLGVNVLFVISSDDAESFPELNALVYGPGADDRIYLQNKLSGYAPPGMSEIFYKWGRFSKNKWYTSASDIVTAPALSYCNSGVDLVTGLFHTAIEPATKKKINPGTHAECMNNPEFVATAWVLMQAPERIYCAANAGVLTGFVSPLNFEYYQHDVILSSANNDDDTIGVVIAFHRDDQGNNHVLSATRTQGGNQPKLGWALVYYKNGAIVKVFGEKDVGGVNTNANTPAGTGWSKRMSKIRVQRAGNLVTAYASPWDMTEGALVLADASKIEIDLGDPETEKILAVFKGAKPYGYMSLSQLGSEYRGVVFSTGASDTYVYDLPNRIVYEKQASGIYKQRKDLDAFTHIGSPRKVGNPDTGKIFQLNEDKSFILLN